MLSRRPTTNASVICVVVTPDAPAFRYRLRERWLEVAPPRTPSAAVQDRPRLPLTALDTLSQRLVGWQRAEGAYASSHPAIDDPAADLGGAAVPHPAAPDRPAGLPAPAGGAQRS